MSRASEVFSADQQDLGRTLSLRFSTRKKQNIIIVSSQSGKRQVDLPNSLRCRLMPWQRFKTDFYSQHVESKSLLRRENLIQKGTGICETVNQARQQQLSGVSAWLEKELKTKWNLRFVVFFF